MNAASQRGHLSGADTLALLAWVGRSRGRGSQAKSMLSQPDDPAVPREPAPKSLPVIGPKGHQQLGLVELPNLAGLGLRARGREDAIRRPSGGFVGTLHGGEVRVRAHVVRGQEEV